MQVRPKLGRAVAASLILWLFPAAASASNACPSTGDVVHVVKDGDTLSNIAVRFYGPSDEAQLRATWEALHAYNKDSIGSDPDHFRYGTGTSLCLPARLSAAGWTLPRKKVALPGSESEWLGGPQSLPTLPASELPEPVKPPVSAPPAMSPAPYKDEAQPPPEGPANPPSRVALEGVVGVMVPLSPGLRDSLFRELGVLAVNLRFAVGPLEITPRALVAIARNGIIWNQVEHPQTVAGGGSAFQLALPIAFRGLPAGHLRVAPGLETGLLYLQREIEPVSTFHPEKPASRNVTMPFAGALLRLEYALPQSLRWKLAIEAASDILLVQTGDFDASQSFTLNVFGGIGHAF